MGIIVNRRLRYIIFYAMHAHNYLYKYMYIIDINIKIT